jgi:hypothetical protein
MVIPPASRGRQYAANRSITQRNASRGAFRNGLAAVGPSERHFYRCVYDAATTAQEFGTGPREEVDPDGFEDLLAALEEILRWFASRFGCVPAPG